MEGNGHVGWIWGFVMSPSVHQTSYQLLCESLGQVLVGVVEAGAVVGSVEVRAVAALYELLRDHPVDRLGRCRSCRLPGEVVGLRRRRCRVHRTAHFYLHHPDDAFFLSHLASEVGMPAPPLAGLGAQEGPGGRVPSGGADPTDLLPGITARPDDSPTIPQSPAALFPPPLPDGGFPLAGRPDPNHGRAGEQQGLPRSRRGPSDDPGPPEPGGALLVIGGVACPT